MNEHFTYDQEGAPLKKRRKGTLMTFRRQKKRKIPSPDLSFIIQAESKTRKAYLKKKERGTLMAFLRRKNKEIYTYRLKSKSPKPSKSNSKWRRPKTLLKKKRKAEFFFMIKIWLKKIINDQLVSHVTDAEADRKRFDVFFRNCETVSRSMSYDIHMINDNLKNADYLIIFIFKTFLTLLFSFF